MFEEDETKLHFTIGFSILNVPSGPVFLSLVETWTDGSVSKKSHHMTHSRLEDSIIPGLDDVVWSASMSLANYPIIAMVTV